MILSGPIATVQITVKKRSLKVGPPQSFGEGYLGTFIREFVTADKDTGAGENVPEGILKIT